MKASGTLPWMAPEIVLDHGPRKPRACDVWSMGCTIFEILADTDPHPGRRTPWMVSNRLEAKQSPMGDDPNIPLQIPPAIRSEMRALLELCFEQDPTKRPEMAKLLDAVERLYAKSLEVIRVSFSEWTHIALLTYIYGSHRVSRCQAMQLKTYPLPLEVETWLSGRKKKDWLPPSNQCLPLLCHQEKIAPIR
jgi:serine/threonine protein kinase